MNTHIATGIALCAFSTLACAHPGHGLELGFWAGWMHPFSGWDHLLVMLALGVWAAKLGGAARWRLPLTFVASMAVGLLLGDTLGAFSWIETALAATLMAMGVLLMISRPWPSSVQIGATIVFALCHGVAHGYELGQSIVPSVGVLLATATLHAIGLACGSLAFTRVRWAERGLAAVMIVLGGFTLVSL